MSVVKRPSHRVARKRSSPHSRTKHGCSSLKTECVGCSSRLQRASGIQVPRLRVCDRLVSSRGGCHRFVGASGGGIRTKRVRRSRAESLRRRRSRKVSRIEQDLRNAIRQQALRRHPARVLIRLEPVAPRQTRSIALATFGCAEAKAGATGNRSDGVWGATGNARSRTLSVKAPPAKSKGLGAGGQHSVPKGCPSASGQTFS